MTVVLLQVQLVQAARVQVDTVPTTMTSNSIICYIVFMRAYPTASFRFNAASKRDQPLLISEMNSSHSILKKLENRGYPKMDFVFILAHCVA